MVGSELPPHQNHLQRFCLPIKAFKGKTGKQAEIGGQSHQHPLLPAGWSTPLDLSLDVS